jgi:hypothetical protein
VEGLDLRAAFNLAGDCGEGDIPRPYRELQALLLGRGERSLREPNGVGFGVAPTARA